MRIARRTRVEVVRRAVEIYLAEHADHQIVLQRLNDPDDPLLTTQEMWNDLRWGMPASKSHE